LNRQQNYLLAMQLLNGIISKEVVEQKFNSNNMAQALTNDKLRGC
jgi:hypothetical protein